jgi:putative transposase
MDCNLYQTLGQVSSDEVGQIFRGHIRGFVREMFSEVMASEVSELCGPKHHPTESDHFRAGSSSGRVLFEGEREDVIRPRARKRNADGAVTKSRWTPTKQPTIRNSFRIRSSLP